MSGGYHLPPGQLLMTFILLALVFLPRILMETNKAIFCLGNIFCLFVVYLCFLF